MTETMVEVDKDNGIIFEIMLSQVDFAIMKSVAERSDKSMEIILSRILEIGLVHIRDGRYY